MAKVRFGDLASDVRGSIAAVTYSKNRYGAYTRPRTAPVQPRTAKQLDQRARFEFWAGIWKTLTSVQRAGWESLALQISKTDSMGQTYNPSGFATYLQYNMYDQSISGVGISNAPILYPMPAFGAFGVVVDASAQTVTITHTAFDLEQLSYLIYATAPVSAGRKFFTGFNATGTMRGGEYKLIHTVVSPDVDPDVQTPSSAYMSIFGPLSSKTGAKISFVFVPILSGVGQTYEPVRVDAIVVA